jgi:hypothetical protein
MGVRRVIVLLVASDAVALFPARLQRGLYDLSGIVTRARPRTAGFPAKVRNVEMLESPLRTPFQTPRRVRDTSTVPTKLRCRRASRWDAPAQSQYRADRDAPPEPKTTRGRSTDSVDSRRRYMRKSGSNSNLLPKVLRICARPSFGRDRPGSYTSPRRTHKVAAAIAYRRPWRLTRVRRRRRTFPEG